MDRNTQRCNKNRYLPAPPPCSLAYFLVDLALPSVLARRSYEWKYYTYIGKQRANGTPSDSTPHRTSSGTELANGLTAETRQQGSTPACGLLRKSTADATQRCFCFFTFRFLTIRCDGVTFLQCSARLPSNILKSSGGFCVQQSPCAVNVLLKQNFILLTTTNTTLIITKTSASISPRCVCATLPSL